MSTVKPHSMNALVGVSEKTNETIPVKNCFLEKFQSASSASKVRQPRRLREWMKLFREIVISLGMTVKNLECHLAPMALSVVEFYASSVPGEAWPTDGTS